MSDRSIKQALSTEEVRFICQEFLEMYDDGHRPRLYTPALIEERAEKVRRLLEDERKKKSHLKFA